MRQKFRIRIPLKIGLLVENERALPSLTIPEVRKLEVQNEKKTINHKIFNSQKCFSLNLSY